MMEIVWSSGTPIIDTPGLRLSIKAVEGEAQNSKITVNSVAAFPYADEIPLRFIKSLFLTVTSETGATLYHAALFSNKVILADDIKYKVLDKGIKAALIAFQFELAEFLSAVLIADKYYLQLTASQYQSPVEIVEVT